MYSTESMWFLLFLITKETNRKSLKLNTFKLYRAQNTVIIAFSFAPKSSLFD